MEGGRRSGDPSGYIVKNRTSSGCLIVKKKVVDGVGAVGSSGSHKVYESKKEKKRLRMMEYSDSGSSDDLLMPFHGRVGPETLRVCNGLSGYEEGDVGRKRNRGEDLRRNEVGLIARNGEDLSDQKRTKLDVFEFDEYDGHDLVKMRRKQFDDGGIEGTRLFGSMMGGRSGIRREYETGSSRHGAVDRRKSLCFERPGGLSDGARPSMLLRDKYDSEQPIRVQGKNGVLKVMVNKKKKVGGSLGSYDRLEAEENRKPLRTEDTVKKNVLMHPLVYSEPKRIDKAKSLTETEKNLMNMKKSISSKNGKVSDQDSEDSETFLKLGPEKAEARNSLKTPLSTKKSKDCDKDSDDSDTSLKLGPKNVEARRSMKGTSSGGEKTPCNQFPETRIKEGKVKRGTGTEKQKLRERIREMLQNAGWTIDYRPRRNRDYLDAVYINPTGTAYWSIIKAYDALIKQLDEDEANIRVDDSPFTPLPDEVLGQLTRNTRKKIEKEMKRKKRDDSDSEFARETTARKPSSTRHEVESLDSGSREEKLSSFLKQGGKSLKSRTSGNGSASINSRGEGSINHLRENIEKPSSGSNSHQGRKSRELGRCTLLVRNSNEGSNSDNDGFVPYSGKRTLLSWLIDCGTVQLSEKVRYMNRRRTKVMLEGWVTRDGIHCGCCSKILTVSKFEIHAGSKLRQPFQNIYLDSGVSLLDCQIEAWNRQESVKRIGFQAVDIDGDDPNDDTCGLCGDGGDLICCDGCPSTFHQSCLDIKMLPPGDWHCPNCICKFCGIAIEKIAHGDDTSISKLLTCSLCLRKYHKSCTQEMDTLPIDADGAVPSFCGKQCKELFEQLQKYLGVRHELEAGFSWSLICRTVADSDASLHGLPQRVECNSKLAVALSVMDECFLPIVDRRSGVNLIHNVFYNCGSNFNRLNFSGFYAVILERGDELISAASIRFHGTQLAEMPFIGTRHMYRRQGMCRRLFDAIESVLCSLKVEKLIIPAISELMHTWTDIFDFTILNQSLKQELKSTNILVFPGIDVLQKQFTGQEHFDGKRKSGKGAQQMEFEDGERIKPEVPNKSDGDSSAGHHHCECDDEGLERSIGTNEMASADSDSQCPVVALNDVSMMKSSPDASHGLQRAVAVEETACADSESEDKFVESALDKKSLRVSDTTHAVVTDDKSQSDSPVGDTSETCTGGVVAAVDSDSQFPGASLDDASVMSSAVNAPREIKNAVSFDGTACEDSKSEINMPRSFSGKICLMISDTTTDQPEENKSEVASPAKDNGQSCKEGIANHVHVLNLNECASEELKISKSVEGMECTDSAFGDKIAEPASEGKCGFPASHGASETETKPVLDSYEADIVPCNEGDLGDTPTVSVDMASLEAVPFMDKMTAENSAKRVNESSGTSVSRSSVAEENNMQIDSDPGNETVHEGGTTMNIVPEEVSETAHSVGVASDVREDSSGSNANERKTESDSI